MATSDLFQVIPLPDSPVWTGAGQEWETVERELGTALPEDYCELIAFYGSGGFCGTFSIASSFGGKRGLKSKHDMRTEFFRGMLSSYGDSRISVYPDKGGILYFGGDEYTNSLTWLTEGEPDEWPLVWFDDHMSQYEVFNMGIVEFLLEWTSGRVTPKVHKGLFDKPPLERRPLFRPSPQPKR